ncbi:KUP/HAK/KT family potassium transporter [Flavobacterium psychrophilum]|uniref:Probable potassium transport system protein Kup n=3 Tax=Flavobacterium psychrophilum TaxID=96345 RepID=KUP_FLAPJ|nr:KUP/HAK/KT family potassium transporter [Flavobacterium psychrophilum]A6GXA1.1 RecName: Full=Probable potassium transport system protein Kup [Flavobacterium psychrophilum JIP02/86]AIG29523.1 potassium transporter Kup [Flavobacterium psychrophilum]AIG31800.1 potassium transporter Kup [Flavobacterium psychrophilum]AIG33954.1 potassium transporter Kup [Flavobacterium psychrophilum]AIG36317.1 potassium transporter Kup [Flavobacterium psychrophilum]AIG38583.1 potassium transporter Kup [Flavobac
MSASSHHDLHSKLSLGGILVTLGIIYGDIGTSPLYVMKSIIGLHTIKPEVVLGGISAIFWTLTLQTTLKYVLITLSADNHGEGGIFALYALVKRTKVKWLIIPAIIGGSALLADGIITPPVSVASAVEGVRTYYPDINTVPIVIAILVVLFTIQQFGTKLVGKFFAPMMMIWFAMLAILGILQITQNTSVLCAVNPYYAYKLLSIHPDGFYVLGFVFLCTTGAEALYSDMGHCGRKNIRISWIFVKIALLLNYFGQGAYLIKHAGHTLKSINANNGNPFYLVMPEWFQPFGIVISTMAAVIASQALISGSFTLINEAMRLNFWPKVKIKYPTDLKGQIYIPSINWLLLAGCIGIVLHFEESSKMEAAYGLAIVLCMIMTTILLTYFMILKRISWFIIAPLILLYLVIEFSFLIANLDKFPHGGYVTLIIASALTFIMSIWYTAKKISKNYTKIVKIQTYKKVLAELSVDLSIPKYATHLVYMTNANRVDEIEEKVMYSILQKRPKRADLYWFIHINITNEPYKKEYKVTEIIKNDLFRIDFNLGFREPTKINLMFKEVIKDMVAKGEVDITSRYESLSKNNIIGDFKFVLSEKFLSNDSFMHWHEKLVMNTYFFFKKMSLSEEQAFGLDSSSVKVEKFPMVLHAPEKIELCRIK